MQAPCHSLRSTFPLTANSPPAQSRPEWSWPAESAYNASRGIDYPLNGYGTPLGISRYNAVPSASDYNEHGDVVFERRVTRDELIAEGSLLPGDDDEYEYYEDGDEFIEDYEDPYQPYEPYDPYELTTEVPVEGSYLPAAYTSYAVTARQNGRPEHYPAEENSDGSEVAIPVAATTVYVPASRSEARLDKF